MIRFDIGELKKTAQYLLDIFKDEPVWCFYGEMGTGKTTLIKEICRILGVQDGMSSPTFSIINEYYSNDLGEIYHFDFYRIDFEEEAIKIGIEEYFYSGQPCFLEWPERIPNLLPDNYLEINIKLVGDNLRELNTTRHE